MKIILLICTVLMVTGCNTIPKPPATVTVYKDVLVPISNIPEPPETNCPLDAVASVVDHSKLIDGDIAKAYRIAVLQLRDCSELREKVLDKYRQLAKEDAKNIGGINKVPVGPFGAANPAADQPSPKADTKRDKRIETDFGELESEFEDLSLKEYSLE